MKDKELLKQADEFLEITRPTNLTLASEVSLVYKLKARLEELTPDKEPQSIVDDREFLNDIDRGDYDARKGYPHKENESPAYDMGYGFRYMIEQMETARSEK